MVFGAKISFSLSYEASKVSGYTSVNSPDSFRRRHCSDLITISPFCCPHLSTLGYGLDEADPGQVSAGTVSMALLLHHV